MASQCGNSYTVRALHSPDFIVPVENSNLTLLSQPQRGHFTLILITSTSEQHGCESCHAIRKVLGKVAQAWTADYLHLGYLYFAEIDLVDRGNSEVFNFLGLKTVPQLWLVPPLSVASKHTLQRQPKIDEYGLEYFDNFDILLEPHAEFKLPEAAFDDQVFAMADWLAKAVQKRITIRQENASTKFIATFLATFLGILIIKKRGPSLITQTVSKKRIYKLAFFAFILVLLGGFLFSLMLKVPFIAKNDNNEPIYISGGTLWQFGVEMVLVGGTYGLLGATLIMLVYLGSYEIGETSMIQSESQHGLLVLFVAGMLYFLYSVLTSMYLRKDEWYPYYFARLF
ncbi:hypothetical protein METBIDRAFT_77851 [Metschnikowia bicuspidata var. bicuspidata NRRL YB-4993]|uniref:Uncharacterized protein n=1 Tax=Metschnikowia bicuspidata var. bicuspidata NRRL YB-4993 TaxID=869754 RepID=A0A1A0HEX7_9ASCO|nr:hypothetical protein METBIDRAFT_77851 [Metschnikowia bicuspidata var. bicuspidata NRRL YB-4993]OBA22463.1 hypothetical protein METBIDRAFT_77851 [Metschnikowia bicuspidata var. bicuspidata NRRL YB-4993]